MSDWDGVRDNDSGQRPDPERPLIGRFHSGGQDTEITSAVKVIPTAGSQRARALDAYRMAWVTDDELHFDYGIGAYPHVAGTRREELIADGWPIVDSGQRRKTRAGSPAIVWKLEDEE